jgi:hypothetical protein
MHHKRLLVLAVALLAIAALGGSAAAAEPRIRDILVTTKGEQVLLYGKVIDGFTQDMDAAIMAGLPVRFTFYADVYQGRSFWFDRRVSGIEVNRTLRYDNLKKIYQVSVENGKEPTAFPTLAEAKAAMSDLNGFPVASVRLLSKNEKYYLLVKAKLDRVTLPLRLEYVFFFVSLWDLETPWHIYRFIYRE